MFVNGVSFFFFSFPSSSWGWVGETGSALKTDAYGRFEVTVQLSLNRVPPPWFWGLSRCIVLASVLSSLSKDYDKAKRERFEADFREMLEPKVRKKEEKENEGPNSERYFTTSLVVSTYFMCVE